MPLVLVCESENKLVISEMWAYVSVDEKGNEGVLACRGGDGTWLPLVGADKEKMWSLRSLAETISKASNMKCKLIRFHGREVVEELG